MHYCIIAIKLLWLLVVRVLLLSCLYCQQILFLFHDVERNKKGFIQRTKKQTNTNNKRITNSISAQRLAPFVATRAVKKVLSQAWRAIGYQCPPKRFAVPDASGQHVVSSTAQGATEESTWALTTHWKYVRKYHPWRFERPRNLPTHIHLI